MQTHTTLTTTTIIAVLVLFLLLIGQCQAHDIPYQERPPPFSPEYKPEQPQNQQQQHHIYQPPETSYERVTGYSTYVDQIGNSFIGVVVGFVFVIGSPLLFWWNERRAVRSVHGLNEAKRLTTPASSDNNTSPSSFSHQINDRPVHVSGMAIGTSSDNSPLELSIGGGQLHVRSDSSDAIKLRARVEMWQWQEKQHSRNERIAGTGTVQTRTRFEYTRTWSEHHINSSSFDSPLHRGKNPSAMCLQSTQTEVNQVHLGPFLLSKSLVSKISCFSKLMIRPQNLVRPALIDSTPIFIENGLVSLLPGGIIYVGSGTIENPQIGDYRITVEQVFPCTVSIVAGQKGNELVPFQTSNGSRVELLEFGTMDVSTMFARAISSSNLLTWGLRAVGFVLQWIGWALMMGPLSTIASIIPIVGGFVSMGVGLASLALATSVTVLVVMVAWLLNRLMLAAVLLLIVGIWFALYSSNSS